MNVIEARGLGKRYGGTWALRDCTLGVPAGHLAALVGPNGAGKTTLMNLAVGLAEPTARDVTREGAGGPHLSPSCGSRRPRRQRAAGRSATRPRARA